MIPRAVLHIPHSSTRVPSAERRNIHLSDIELQAELIKMTDWYTDELFHMSSEVAPSVVFPVSRLVVDPERFSEDLMESMSERGMGVIYTKTSNGGELRAQPSSTERSRMLNKYYHPHYKQLEGYVKSILQKNGRVLVIDCHSFPSKPLPHEINQSKTRPDICIGTDAFHTPNWIPEFLTSAFEAEGYVCSLNLPYSGALVPMAYYQKNKSVSAIMIEVNRELYIDEESGTRKVRFVDLHRTIQGVLRRLLYSFCVI